jgi:hypothetical protein
MKIQRCAYPIRNRNARRDESGVALIIALLTLLIVSTLAAGLMYTTQSEIWTTANYRAVTAARYAAEAGVQRATYWISQNNAALAADIVSGSLVVTGVPVTTSGGNTVVLAPPSTATTGIAAPIAGITDTFSLIDSSLDTTATTSFNKTLNSTTSPFPTVAGTPNYTVAVQLLSATNDPQAGWITSWKIISQGTVSGVRQSKVQVVATVENKIIPSSGTSSVSVPAFKFGAWANSASCDAIEITGGSNTESYNSSTQLGVASPSLTTGGGDIATLGNVYLHNTAMVDGNIFAPNYNLGNPSAGYSNCAPPNCPFVSTYYPYGVTGGSGPDSSSNGWNANNKTVQACSTSWPYAVQMDNSGGTGFGCTSSSSSSCVNKASMLPTGYTTPYPTASLPSGAPTTNNTSTCSYSTECAGNYGTGALTIPPSNSSYGQVTLGSNDDYYFSAGNYYFDTLTVTASARIHLTSNPVVVYILNGAGVSEPINFTGGSQTNQGGDPNNLTFVYNGTQEVHFGSISSNAVFATVYAPNSKVVFDGNGNIFGAVIGNTVSMTGGGHLNYDSHLALSSPHVYTGTTSTNSASTFHLTEFSWSAF